MKIRDGFVSNSSSSSFVCGVCSRTAEGWDWNNSGGGIHTCTKGHTFCYEHSLNKDDEFWACMKHDNQIPEKYCPICNGHGKYSLNRIYKFLVETSAMEISEREFVNEFMKWDRRYYES